jgi:hypothetical protein
MRRAFSSFSFNYASALREEIQAIAWDLVVIDEAHKLRNAYRPSNKVGQGIRWATEDCRKLLLTATPLQNSLVELYGLSTLIDEHLFGDINAFRARYASAGSSMTDLRQRLATFCKRTLRNQVVEYVRYTERRAITRPFTSSDAEHSLYEAVSAFLQRPNSYALPQRQRHLTALILRKLLASSSLAIAGTLDTLRARLETLRDEQIKDDPEFAERLIESEDIEDELLMKRSRSRSASGTLASQKSPALEQAWLRWLLLASRLSARGDSRRDFHPRSEPWPTCRLYPASSGSTSVSLTSSRRRRSRWAKMGDNHRC